MTDIVANYLGGSASDTSAGYTHKRLWLMSDVAGPDAAVEYQALNHPAIPKRGRAHPVIPGIKVIDRHCRKAPNGTARQVLVEVNYGVPTASDESGGSQVGRVRRSVTFDSIQEETIEDIYGNKLRVAYASLFTGAEANTEVQSNNPNKSENNRRSAVSLSQEVKRVNVERPTVSIRFSQANAPWPIQFLTRDIVGSVNDRPWGPFKAKTWLYRGLSSSENDDGSHELDHLFTYRRDTWIATILATANNVIPDDISLTNGIGKRDVYPLFNFNSLGFNPA